MPLSYGNWPTPFPTESVSTNCLDCRTGWALPPTRSTAGGLATHFRRASLVTNCQSSPTSVHAAITSPIDHSRRTARNPTVRHGITTSNTTSATPNLHFLTASGFRGPRWVHVNRRTFIRNLRYFATGELLRDLVVNPTGDYQPTSAANPGHRSSAQIGTADDHFGGRLL
jgi:hypothetical protein